MASRISTLRPRTRASLLILPLLLAVLAPLALGGDARAATPPATAGGFLFYKHPQPQPVCGGLGINNAVFSRTDCGFSIFQSDVAPAEVDQVKANLYGPGADTPFTTVDTAYDAVDEEWQFSIRPDDAWPAGEIRVEIVYQGDPIGGASFFHNLIGGRVIAEAPEGAGYQAGDDIPVDIELFELQGVANASLENPVPATFTVQVVLSDGTIALTDGPFEASSDGTYEYTVPGSATDGVEAGPTSNFRTIVSVEVVDVTYDDPATGAWAAERAGFAPVQLVTEPTSLIVRNDFISSVGWVKPGDTYPFRISVDNHFATAVADATVTVPPVDGTTFTRVAPASNAAGIAVIGADGTITWDIGEVPAGGEDQPRTLSLIVEARADSVDQDPEVVWKDLSTTATLTYQGGPVGLTSRSLGPKVVPPGDNFDSSRYGVRPFPVVPVDWRDRKHDPSNTGDRIDAIINSPDVPGSTRNLYEEMSFGQLRPVGELPSNGIATANWDVEWNSERYQESDWSFTESSPQGVCYGTTSNAFPGTPLLPTRIENGWYQLPGDTGYYGGDRYSAGSLVGAIGGVGAIFAIDDACGPTGKAVYDAAHIADPEIDYNEFDTDKDGIVDFFMMLFVGLGGNGDSQINGTPPYDNIWPHSSSLEFYFTDPETGLKGYVTDDQLTDLEGNDLFWTDENYSNYTTEDTGIPAYVRVGPYNVNPESSIEKASVISHEYGHSLGLPDYYSLGSRETYGTWNLMAADYSQHMTIHAKQDMGWVVPEPLTADTTVSDWTDSKVDTHRIVWQRPDGTPYVLEGPDVHNYQAYTAKLPARQIIDPAIVENGASPPWVYFSGSGNDFGCAPEKGHNLDIYLPELEDVAPGAEVKLAFKTWFDIEWDYDYGFVLITADDGESYQSVESEQGYSTPASQNPNQNSCQAQYGNGLTGTSGSYQAGTSEIDRVAAEYPEGDGFVDDAYDISALAGSQGVVRFSYATDPGLARPGWFIDDVVVTVDGEEIYTSDFAETHEDGRLFPGGCGEEIRVAAACTVGWSRISASAGSPADHGYYLELRDRTSFDFKDGRGQSDRGDLSWSPGLVVEYTDESRGYGNTGVDNQPAQTILDSQPQPTNQTPGLDDAAFTAAELDRAFSDHGDGWTDNYTVGNVDGESGNDPWVLAFDCLGFEVGSMSGDDIGPLDPPYDLTADVTFDIGDGCAPFDFGHGGGTVGGQVPTAAIQFRPETADVGEEIVFDGSQSTDDRGPQNLTYRWNLGDGTQATGQVVKHAYDEAGTYTVNLTVTDADGNSDIAVAEIVIGGGGPGGDDDDEPSGAPLPTTGGGLVLLGLTLLGGAFGTNRLRRR